MRTKPDTLKTAAEQVGIMGTPNPWWSLPSGNCCLGFLTWCMGIRDRNDYTPALISIAKFRATYRWGEVPAPLVGDLVVLDWEGDGVADHIEVVTDISTWASHGTVATIGANTGSPLGVYRKTRMKANVVTFIRPPYPGSSTASEGSTLLIEEENPVTFTIYKEPDPSPVQWVQSLIGGARIQIQQPSHRQLLDRAKDRSKDGEERFNAEADIVAGYLAAINPSTGVNLDSLTAKLTASNDADTSAILAAIGKVASSGADPDVIAAKVKDVLAGNFTQLPDDVANKLAQRIAS